MTQPPRSAAIHAALLDHELRFREGPEPEA